MKFALDTVSAAEVKADAVVVYLDDQNAFGEALSALDALSDGYFRQLQESGDLPKSGKIAVFPRVPGVKARHVVVCAAKNDRRALEKQGANLLALALEKGWKTLALAFAGLSVGEDSVCRVVLAAGADAAYRFNSFKSKDERREEQQALLAGMKWLWLSGKNDKKTDKAQLKWVEAWQAGSYLARDLGNTPGNVCTPNWLGGQAKAMAERHKTLSVTVLKRKEIAALGMGAMLGVAQGSAQEPRFIVMEYTPKKAVNSQPVVLVGKGVTFDAGGISLKPAADMDLMKYDMGGAAAVFGAMEAIAEAALAVHVVALVPAVENLPGGNAIKPGDILTSMSGKTIEVLNTDAEGRLILCDALTYAERYQPQAVIDLATLTGACVIALGSPRAGLFGNDDALKSALAEAGEAVNDKAWTMPMDEEYVEMMKSPFADLANISSSREAGAVTAAGFLSHFTKAYPWAHLDIAGVAWRSHGERKGGTGRPVGLLLEYFSRLAGQ